MPILLGDISDQPSINAIAKDARVIISTAGPFMRLGKPIVDACVRQGTHYCDITGGDPEQYVLSVAFSRR